jgi:hypothetical protein
MSNFKTNKTCHICAGESFFIVEKDTFSEDKGEWYYTGERVCESCHAKQFSRADRAAFEARRDAHKEAEARWAEENVEDGVVYY